MWLTEPNIDIARLSGIDVPALIIAGDRDVIDPKHTRSIATAIPDGRLCIVPNAGHGLMEDRADFVNFVVSEFLREHADRSARHIEANSASSSPDGPAHRGE